MTEARTTSVISLPSGYNLFVYDELDSSNAEALRLAESSSMGAVWVWAKTQTAGRGRQGRTWISSANDLKCSLLLTLQRPVSEIAQLSFVTSLAVRDALDRFEPNAPIALKWPNDVLIGGAKTAGILLESHGSSNETETKLAIGIGINISSAPEGLPYPATCLGNHLKILPSAAEVLQLLVRAFADWFEIWTRDGFSTIRAAWLAHAHALGSEIRVKLGEEEIIGVFNTITQSGELDLLLPSGQHRAISAGEVFFEQKD